eukprot:2661602-Pyramimonas_sp.AAC.1
MCSMVKQVCKASSMYIGVASLRVLTGAFCTSSRFHSAPAGCLFGCAGKDTDEDTDSLRHYAHRPKLCSIMHKWPGDQR